MNSFAYVPLPCLFLRGHLHSLACGHIKSAWSYQIFLMLLFLWFSPPLFFFFFFLIWANFESFCLFIILFLFSVFVFLAERHMGPQAPSQGLNPHPGTAKQSLNHRTPRDIPLFFIFSGLPDYIGSTYLIQNNLSILNLSLFPFSLNLR